MMLMAGRCGVSNLHTRLYQPPSSVRITWKSEYAGPLTCFDGPSLCKNCGVQKGPPSAPSLLPLSHGTALSQSSGCVQQLSGKLPITYWRVSGVVFRKQNIMRIGLQIANNYHQFSYFACKTDTRTVKIPHKMHQISPFLSSKIKNSGDKDTAPS